MPYRTAITRRKLSRPAQWLLESGLIQGRILDYGCGRGGDAKLLEAQRFDPHFQPYMPRGEFDTILCTFVLNVVDKDDRKLTIKDVAKRLKPRGMAFFAVRRDMKGDYRAGGKAGWNQYLVKLDMPLVYECSGFAIYMLDKGAP